MKEIPIALMGYVEDMAGRRKILRKKDNGSERMIFVTGYDPRVSVEQFMELFEYLVFHGWEVCFNSTPRKTIKHFSHYCILTSPDGYEFRSFGATVQGCFSGAALKAAQWHIEEKLTTKPKK